ncbi:MAG TPA: peptidylprolyl isomerase [Opitutales bacterium]|nr:peptidylprolyl isomerase [Opitutales bacterium]
MSVAKKGNTVRVHFTGTLEDGTVFDTSKGQEPLEFTLGENDIIAGFQNAVIGMNPGEIKKELIPVNDAYGPRREEMLIEIERDQLPPEIEPEAGLQLQMTTTDGRQLPVKITEVNDATIKLDANHPLAGENLLFELELVEIV